MENSYQKVYGDIDKNVLKSIWLFYRDNVIYYTKNAEFNTDYIPLIKKHKFTKISGKESVLKPLLEHFPELNPELFYFLKADKLTVPFQQDEQIIEVQTEEQMGDLHDILKTIEEFDVYNNQTKKEFIAQKKPH
ncbi:MAG: hypothetical protein K9L74_00500 [Candidatus Izimaplasma sp.]|nr:hypothetical protein [Candidatus Izimaplasma bacterium]